MVDSTNRGLTSVRDVYDPLPDDVEHFGIDHTGPLPLNEDMDNLEIPETHSPLTGNTHINYKNLLNDLNHQLTLTMAIQHLSTCHQYAK